jgi:hypothetical protein
VPIVAEIDSNGSFSGAVPGWGTGELVALTSARVVSSETIVTLATQLNTVVNVTYQQVILQHGSLEEHSTQVSSSGDVSLSLGSTNGTGFLLFAFYQRLSGNQNVVFNSSQDWTIFDNGSYNVDHYSGRGAQTVVKFWDKYILTDRVVALLQQAGNYGKPAKTASRSPATCPGRATWQSASSASPATASSPSCRS